MIGAISGYLFPFIGMFGGAYLGEYISRDWSSYFFRIAFSACLCGVLSLAGGTFGFLWYFVLASCETRMAQED